MIFVDYTDCIPLNGVKIHGGAEYARRVLTLLAKNGLMIEVLIPKEYKDYIREDKALFSRKEITVTAIEGMEVFHANDENAILFIPLIATHRMRVISAIKANNPNLKVYVTIHGTRLLDLKPDIMDMFYKGKRNRELFFLGEHVKYFASKILYKYTFSKFIPLFDGVITVSNDSLQKIQRLSSPVEITIFYEGSQNIDKWGMREPVAKGRKNIFLFVSGGRPEKNLLRTLIAFQNLKQEGETTMRLIATGISEEKKTDLLKCSLLDASCMESNVIFLPYVSDEKLDELYRSCKFILYPSKSEGFGLPLVDSCLYGIPCITSSLTATSEVLGSSAIYVDPYSVRSIQGGMRCALEMEYEEMLEGLKKTQKRVIASIEAADYDFVRYMKRKVEEIQVESIGCCRGGE